MRAGGYIRSIGPLTLVAMKHLFSVSALLPSLAFGQSLVTTVGQNRTVLLEDFTGIHCGYCPEGHAIAASLEAANPGRVSTVGVHAGGFAVPSGGEPDFRTPEGNTLDSYYNIQGYPAGIINKHAFDDGYEQGRGAWEGDVAEILALSSPVNLGVESSYDAGTQQLTVHVQLYYTGDSPGGADRISVLITENHLNGPQVDYGPAGNHANYDHKHVLRDYITDLWGEEVTTTTAGTWVDRTYTFTLSPSWNVTNCDVVAFVGEYQSDVYQARTVPADGGTTLVIGNLQGDPQPFRGGGSGVADDFSLSLTNELGADEDYIISLVPTGGPSSWATGLTVNGIDHAGSATVTVAASAGVDITAHITPDAAPGIGDYLLTVASSSNPAAPLLQQDLHVISGVHDLVVSNPQAEQWEPLYVSAMQLSNEAFYAVTTRERFTRFGEAGALTEVLNVYVNASWTFPGLLDDEVAVLAGLMDNGVNLMIAGQDVGWDQSGAEGSYGTPATQAFYADYMHAEFINDGNTSNNPVNFVDDDAVFGSLPNSSVANVFSGNTYPEQIAPIAPAVPILKYGTTEKIGGLRAQTSDYKVVYFGVGPEQMSSADVGKLMVGLSHDWFYGIVGIEELDALTGALGQAYPVPADTRLTIPVEGLQTNATLDVFDATGRIVSRATVGMSATQVQLDTEALVDGLYSYRLTTAKEHGRARSFVVAH